LDHRLPGTDPDLLRLLQTQVDALEAEYGDDLPGQVRHVLRTALLTDHARSDQVAKLLSVHSRTLSRRLNACGTSFQELLDEGRFEIARQMLEDTRVEGHQIAETLDYADASAFTRAFRRWSGITPTQWRKNRKATRSRMK
jgi:AraC-like DNA-binding protein